MSLTTSNPTFDLIFMFGPPLFDKLSYLPESLLRQDYIQITLSKLFEDNPSFGLRDVSLQIISELKKGKQVIIEDELHSANTRKSILSTVKKKVSNCKALLVKITPVHGLLQVLWTHQNAHGRGFLSTCSCQKENASARRWFDASSLSVDYRSGIVDPPDESEGFAIKDVQAQYQLQSSFKCEVPGLFIQWEAAISDTGDLNAAVVTICRRWTTLNEHGRIILLNDGKKDFRSSRRENAVIHQHLKELSVKVGQPIYVMRVTNASHTNSFCIPPQPGLMAFVQTRFFIDLLAKHTVYIFETTDHMKMAQAAGVRFVKSSKAYRYPEKTLSSLCVIPPVASMLRDMSEIKRDLTTPGPVSLPLIDKCIDSDEGFAFQSYHNGVEEFVFISDVTQILKVQESFASHVTPTDMPGSKMATKEDDSVPSYTSSRTKDTDRPEGLKRDGSIQNLPVWMTRLNRKSTEWSMSSLESDEPESSFKFTKTVYLMSEKELKEMAIQVMKQAGRTVQEKTPQEAAANNNHPS